jgi:chromosome partitioning protein
MCVHQKGGVGKSIIALNLAIHLSQNSKVAILDLDHQGSLSQLKSKFDQLTITNDASILKQKKDFDFIVIDTPPYLSNKLPRLIRESDLILVPTKAGILDVLAITSTLDLIKQEKMDSKALIVFNMIKPNTTLTADMIDSVLLLNIKIAKTKISDLVAFTRSVVLKGVSQNSKAQNQMNSLTKEVLTQLQ